MWVPLHTLALPLPYKQQATELFTLVHKNVKILMKYCISLNTSESTPVKILVSHGDVLCPLENTTQPPFNKVPKFQSGAKHLHTHYISYSS